MNQPVQCPCTKHIMRQAVLRGMFYSNRAVVFQPLGKVDRQHRGIFPVVFFFFSPVTTSASIPKSVPL